VAYRPTGFQTELVLNTRVAVSDIGHDVANTYHIVSDTQEVVSGTHNVVSDTHNVVSNTHNIVSDIHRTMVKNRTETDDRGRLASESSTLLAAG
jgi:hypothetical protein